jgi:hypothetical protein
MLRARMLRRTLARWTAENRWPVWLVGSLAHVAIFAGLFRSVYRMPFSGTGLFYEYAGKVLAGGLPYRDFVLEYPPLALLFFTLPRLLGESFRWYYVWFQTEVVVFDLAVVATLYCAARRWNLSPARLLTAYTLAVLAVGPIALHQFDIFPAAFLLFAIVALAAGRTTTAAVFLALGVMTKVYPILIAPVFVLAELRRGRMSNLIRPVAVFVATCFVLTLPWLLIAPRSLGVFFAYHANRGIHIDSTYGTIALAAHSLVGATATIVFTYASWNLAGPLPDFLARASTWVLLGSLALAYAVIDRRIRQDENKAAPSVQFLATAATLVLAAALPTSKVLSPQYLIWLMPALPLLERPVRNASLAIFAAAGVVTYFMYPLFYDDFLARYDWAISMMILRNALLIALAVLIGRSLFTPIERAQIQRT